MITLTLSCDACGKSDPNLDWEVERRGHVQMMAMRQWHKATTLGWRQELTGRNTGARRSLCPDCVPNAIHTTFGTWKRHRHAEVA